MEIKKTVQDVQVHETLIIHQMDYQLFIVKIYIPIRQQICSRSNTYVVVRQCPCQIQLVKVKSLRIRLRYVIR